VTSTSNPQDLPLVVDLDGTLTPTDTLVESMLMLFRRGPLWWLRMLTWLFGGRAQFKRRVSDHASLAMAQLPWREPLLDWLRAERRRGRRLVLATAADQRIAHAVAEHLQLFDTVLATRDGHNLKGVNKLEAIRREVGTAFVYAGDHAADLPIWAGARGAVVVGARPDVARRAAEVAPVERSFDREAGGPAAWLRAMRVHQWLKNLLLFVPLLTSFQWSNWQGVAAVLVAFLSFSLTASGSYLLNDIWDIASDRQHPRKRLRPFASGVLSPLAGVAMSGLLILLGLLSACLVSQPFAAMVAGYLVLTTAYSWSLKRYVLLDALTLAMLYTYRVLAGAVAIQVPVTPWLLAFAVFLFISLALVKRCAELVSMQQMGQQRAGGRDYAVEDLVVLWPLGVGCSLSAVVVFGLYLGTEQAQSAYGRSPALWLVGVGLIYWQARMWIKTARGEMHDDPIVFALRDQGSRLILLAMVSWVVLVRLFH
jgi:4-hydroxybenzoate polyprenyltransferase/phosphoserine phosphatase